MKKIVIIGAGGHAKVIADIILQRKRCLKENLKIIGFLDDKYVKQEKCYLDIPIIGKLDKINDLINNQVYFLIAIGDNLTREKISKKYSLKYYRAIHPNAVIAQDVNIGEGTVVMANVVINSSSNIGKHCIINTSSVIEHDNFIADYAHISPNVSLAGNISIGKRSWIGIGSSVIQGISIGNDTIIGAGSVVVRNIKEGKKAYGVPCRER